jgi:acyl carrier protein
MTRLAGAIRAVREAVAVAAELPIDGIEPDDDLVDDIGLDELERESLGLILETVFNIAIPDELWNSPLYRTPASLAEWCIRKSDEAEWAEVRRQRKRA